MRMGLLLVFVSLVAIAGATKLDVWNPITQTLYENDTVAIGTAGPGQTVYIEANKATTGGKWGIGSWDLLEFVGVPNGWSGDKSRLYEQPLKARLKIGADAQDGEYLIRMRAVDEDNLEGLGELYFYVKVVVSKDVLRVSAAPGLVVVGAGQPAVYQVKIENTGSASDIFEVSASGLPVWRYKKTVFVPFNDERRVSYEVVSSEENRENEISINVVSLSSSEIAKSSSVRLRTSTDLIADYKALRNGLLIFPFIEQPVYSIIAFFSNFLQ